MSVNALTPDLGQIDCLIHCLPFILFSPVQWNQWSSPKSLIKTPELHTILSEEIIAWNWKSCCVSFIVLVLNTSDSLRCCFDSELWAFSLSFRRKVWLSKVGSPSSRIDHAEFSNERDIPKLEIHGFGTRYWLPEQRQSTAAASIHPEACPKGISSFSTSNVLDLTCNIHIFTVLNVILRPVMPFIYCLTKSFECSVII